MCLILQLLQALGAGETSSDSQAFTELFIRWGGIEPSSSQTKVPHKSSGGNSSSGPLSTQVNIPTLLFDLDWAANIGTQSESTEW